MNILSKKYLIPVFAVIIFFLAFFVRFYPVFHKGYSSGIFADTLILARNLSLNNEYKLESEKNVILNSSLVKDEGIVSDMGNKLTPVLYSKIFDIFGFNSQTPLYVSLILYSLTSVLLFLIILKLFNFWVASIFALIDIFSPLVLANSSMPGLYEWASFLFVLGLFVYLYKDKLNYFQLFVAGLIFGLSSLAGNIFLVSFVPFLIYEFFRHKSFKRSVILIVPVILLWAIYLGPGIIRGKVDNPYLTPKSASSASFLHLFPDPYTYHFEGDQYLKALSNTFHPDSINALIKRGYHVKFSQRLWLFFSSAIFYVKEFFRLTNIGGALTILFFFSGLVYSIKKKNRLIFLFTSWGIIWYLALVGYGTSSSHHFLELRFPIFLLISLGVYWISGFILNLKMDKKFRYILVFVLFFFILLDLGQSDKWMFHENYENSNMDKILAIASDLKNADINKQTDVIAVGVANANNAPLIINYYTDLSSVYFDAQTVKNLLKENRLKEAFDEFGVTAISGYEPELIEQILQKITVKSF